MICLTFFSFTFSSYKSRMSVLGKEIGMNDHEIMMNRAIKCLNEARGLFATMAMDWVGDEFIDPALEAIEEYNSEEEI